MTPPAPTVTCQRCGKRNRLRPEANGIPRCGNCHAPLPWLVDAGPESLDAELDASVPVLVDLWASWCGPCKWIAPVMEALAREHAGHAKVVRVNVDEAPEISARFAVKGIPTLVLIHDGEEVDRVAGALPKPQLEEWLEGHLGARASSAAT
jgi:thioredoxin 2